MTDKKWKRMMIQEAALDILGGNEPISLISLTDKVKLQVKPIRGVYKITPQMVAQALRGQSRIHKFTHANISMYYAD